MDGKSRLWENRYKRIKKLENYQFFPFSEKIEIEQYIAEDLLLKQNVILKLIKINEDPEIKSLAQFLWHYEISLNQKATNNSHGKTLLKLVDAQRDEEKGLFVLVTESGGSSLKEVMLEEDETENNLSFKNFRFGDKKRIWESILKLTQGLYSLHTSGLIHRNISLSSIYFDDEAYRQGEPEILKIGDFNWSIYLNSLSNLFTNEITSDIVKNNYHFFRAPECLPVSIDDKIECFGETYQSDLFSLGLVLVFLLINLDINKYLESKIEVRHDLYKEIQEKVKGYQGYPQEKDILSKLIEIDLSNRFINIGELLDKIQELVNVLKHNFSNERTLPINFKLDRTAPFLNQVANEIDINIDALLKEPNKFLSNEFNNNSLYLTNDLEFPLWTRGKSGAYYKFRKAFKRSNIAQIQKFTPRFEQKLKLTNIEVCNTDQFYWLDINDSAPYSNWEAIFANATSQIRERQTEYTEEQLKKMRWLKIINLIEEAEEDIEERGILEYDLIEDTANEKDTEKNEKRRIIINVINDEEKDLFTEIVNDAQNKNVELLDTDSLFEPFKVKRMWKLNRILEDTQNFTTVELEGTKRNENLPDNGFIRLWDLRSTIFLLKRKRQIVQNIEENELLLNAILQPASSHKYFEKYNKDNIVSYIYYTNPIFLLQGPPGTGKTWTAKELIKLTLEKDPYLRILVASKEHAALDDLLIKCVNVLKDSKISPYPNIIRLISPERELYYPTTSIPYKHFITQVTKILLKNISEWNPNDEKYLKLLQEVKNITKNELESPSKEWIELVKESSNLVFCTSTAHDLKELEFMQNFDLVVIEEAGKTYPSELFKPMQLGSKWVLIGDQNQLPPFRIEDINKILDKKLDDEEIENKDKPDFDPKDFLEFKKEVKSEIKIFQSMFDKFQKIKHSFDETDDIKSCDTLLDQHRLPSKISKMISTIFYNQLFNQKIEDPINFLLEPFQFKNEQLVWLKTSSSPEFRETREGIDLYNIKEVSLIKQLLSRLKISKRYPPASLAILSPYKEQVEKLKSILPDKLSNLNGINIKNRCFTVDSFQGQEADLVIISLVRNNNYETSRRAWGFIPRPERLNVMLSRAMKIEIIVGNFDMCLTHNRDPYMEKFTKVAKFIQKEGIVIDYDEVLK